MSDLPHNQSSANDDLGACDACRELLGAYVLQALDRFDQGMVEQHLRWCDACRAELDALEAIGTGLALGVPDTGLPSASTWSAIQARLTDNEETVAPRNAPAPANAGTSASRWMQWLPMSVMAPLALAVIVLGAWGWSVQKNLDQTEAELANHALLNSTLTSNQQVQLFTMEQSCPTCDGVGQVGVSQSNGMGMVVGWDFDPAMTHDVWGVDHDGERSRVCSLVVAKDGAVMQMFHFPDTPSRYTDIYVTDEAGQLVYTSHIVEDETATPEDVSQS